MDRDLGIIIKQIDILCKSTGVAETEEFKSLFRTRILADGASKESLESLMKKVKRLDAKVALVYGLQQSSVVRPNSERTCHRCGKTVQKGSYCLSGNTVAVMNGHRKLKRTWFHEGCARMVYEVARVYQREVDRARSMGYEPEVEDF